MTPQVFPRRQSVSLWIAAVAFAIAVACFGVVAMDYLNRIAFQSAAERRFEPAVSSIPGEDTMSSTPAFYSEVLGRLTIPEIQVKAAVIEGVDNSSLAKAVGHVPGTARPGASGNVAIAGHRDTFFRQLGKLKPGDDITLTTSKGDTQYRVRSAFVVKPSDVWVLERTKNATLTLITCYPFQFIGSAPNRYIVKADRIAP